MNRWVRIGAALTLGVGFGLLPGAQAALAAPKTVCTVNDARLPNIVGMVAIDDGYAVIAKQDASQVVKIFLLDAQCQVTGTLSSDINPRDTEDLARTSDGTYWVADTGDSDTAPERETVAVHEFPQSGTKTIQRMKYPDGPKNAQALLVQNANVPVVVTKSTSGTASVYKASQPITGPSKDAANAVPLTLVGKVTLGSNQAVTGAATAPDGKRVALRTSDAIYEWDVTGGDIANSLVKGKPRKTALTAADGGAVAYSANGKTFLTTPTGSANNPAAAIQSWPIATTSTSGGSTATKGADADSGGSLLSGISFGQLTALVGVVGVVGLGLLAAGIVGIVRFRRRSTEGTAPTSGISSRAPDGLGPQGRPGGPEQVGETVQMPRVGGSTYGGGRPSEPARGGAAVVPPSPRSGGRDGRNSGVGAGVGQAGWSPSGGRPSESDFRSEGAPVSGPAGAARGGAPVSGPAGAGRGGATVYGGGRSADPETTGSGRARPPQGRAPGGRPQRPGPDDPATTGGGRVRRPGPPREIDPPRGRDADGWDRGGPSPAERSAPTRQRRAAPPPPGTTYGRDPESRGGGRDGARDGGRDWEGPTTGSSGRVRPPSGSGDRMRPPPPPGGERERGRRDPRREAEGRPPAPPGRRPPAPPEWSRRDD